MADKLQSDIGRDGKVRGWHGGCRAAEPSFYGTYALVLGPDGRVDCEACGATDLVKGEAWKPSWMPLAEGEQPGASD